MVPYSLYSYSKSDTSSRPQTDIGSLLSLCIASLSGNTVALPGSGQEFEDLNLTNHPRFQDFCTWQEMEKVDDLVNHICEFQVEQDGLAEE